MKQKSGLKFLRRTIRVYLNRLLGREFVEIKHPVLEVSGVCNLKCVFCAYKSKEEGKVIVPEEDFRRYVDQLTDLGYREIHLTPNTGDVFVDKGFVDKLAILENHPNVDAYEFITNLIGASYDSIDVIARSKKLSRVSISLYGHDRSSFEVVTDRSGHQYDRLVKNLSYLAGLGPRVGPTISSFCNTDVSFDWSPDNEPRDDDSELMIAIRNVARNVPSFVWTGNHVEFDSWGGVITQADLDEVGKGFKLVGPDDPMVGPCDMLFGGAVVLADGRVNACSCRAIKGDLVIGDAKMQALNEILSPSNPRFSEILEAHIGGRYPEACRNCKVFSSIYRKPRGRPTETISSYVATQSKRCATR